MRLQLSVFKEQAQLDIVNLISVKVQFEYKTVSNILLPLLYLEDSATILSSEDSATILSSEDSNTALISTPIDIEDFDDICVI